MIQGSQKEHSHVSQMEQGRNLGGGMEWNIHRKDKKNNKHNKHNKNDGAGSRYIERLRSKLFRKVQKYWKGSRKARKAQEGPERAVKGSKWQGKAGKGTSAWKYIRNNT